MASPGLDINLRDPMVQRMLGTDDPSLVSSGKPEERELVQIAGDQPQMPYKGYSQSASQHGMQSTIRMTESAQGHPVIKYNGKHGEYLLTADLYAFPGEPMRLVLLCPRCSVASGAAHALTIQGDQKKIEYDPNDFVNRGGRLSVEAFECTWELEGQKAVDRNQNVNIVIGGKLCRWKVSIENNVARDA